MTSPKPEVHAFYEPRTASVQYVVWDPATRACAVVDPVLDFDEKSGATATRSADEILAFIAAERLDPVWILDTHPHADHFSAAAYLKEKTGAPMGIGAEVVAVQRLWKDLYNLPDTFPCDGSQWDRLFAHGERFPLGGLEVGVSHAPGHTLASITYHVGDAAFIHDTLFMPDSGSARCDFPGGSAHRLWRTIQDILALDPDTRLFVGHDYRPGGREAAWQTSPREQRAGNAHVRDCPDEASFVAMREARDKTLPMPRLILHALQVNIRGGRLPEPESNGRRYLRIPLDALPGAAWSS
jgi:glyoxylase-like metal-dependent hydrolase (beta-lactamase superfamily II)